VDSVILILGTSFILFYFGLSAYLQEMLTLFYFNICFILSHTCRRHKMTVEKMN